MKTIFMFKVPESAPWLCGIVSSFRWQVERREAVTDNAEASRDYLCGISCVA